MADPRIKNLAYDALAATLGAPVDLFAAALRPFGYQEQPVLGSQFIRQRLPQQELPAIPAPTQEFVRAATMPEVPQVDQFGRVIRQAPTPERQFSTMERIIGGAETAESILRGVAGFPVALGGAVIEGIKQGDVSPRRIETRMSSILENLGYTPKTEAGREMLGQTGKFLERLETEYKVPAIGGAPSAAPLLGVRGVPAQVSRAVETEFERPPLGQISIGVRQAIEPQQTAAGNVSIRPEQLDLPTSQVVMRGQEVPPMTRTPTAEEIEIARADTRMGQNIVADRLNVIVPETERVRGGIYRPGQPDGQPWSALTPEQLAQRGEGFKGTDLDLQRMWNESIDESSAAAKQAVERTGATWSAFDAAKWDRAFKLPARSQLWYELSGESFVNRLPELTTREMLTFLDLIGATSARADPLQNLERSLAIMSQKLRGVPVDVDVTIPSTVSDALRREGTNISSDLANKTGMFSDTLALTGGLPVRYPISVNDVWVGKAFGITDEQLGSNQALHEVFAKYMNKIRDFHNQTANPQIPHESWHNQARQWVEMRASDMGIDTTKMASVEGSDYAGEFNKVIKKLEKAGIDVPNGIITKEIMMNPRFADALRPTTPAFREAPKATVEFGTLLTPAGKRGAEIYEAAKMAGDELTQRDYIKILTGAMYESARGKPTPWQNLVRVATDRAESVTRIYSPTSQDPFAIAGTFQGAAGPNIRIPFRDMTPDQIAYANAVAGLGLKQKAMAAAEIRRLNPGESLPEGYMATNSIRFDFTGPVPERLLVDITKELGDGFEISAMRYPDGLVVDINPRFGANGPESPTAEAIDRATDMLEERYKAGNVKVFPSAYRSEFGKNYVEDPGTGAEYNRIIKDTLKGWNDEAITRITDLAGKGVKRADIAKFLAGKLEKLPVDSAKLPEGSKADGIRGRAETIRKQLRQRISDHNASVKAFSEIGKSIDKKMSEALPKWERRAEAMRKKAEPKE